MPQTLVPLANCRSSGSRVRFPLIVTVLIAKPLI
jgi:hypothetical protein